MARSRYYFSTSRARRAVNFFEKLLKHSKGEWAGKPFILEPWQRDIIRKIFGWIDRESGFRRYSTVYIEVPKKQGKSPLAAGIALYLLLADAEPGAEIYCAAGDKYQAAIVFDYARDFVVQSDDLGAVLDVRESTHRILYRAEGSLFRAVSSDVPTKHGPNISGLIFDELHSQPNRELWDTLHTGTAARRQPLTVAITTAGVFDESSICWEQHEYARKVNAGLIDDPNFLGVIYAMDDGDDWRDEKVWHKANPSLGTVRKIDQMRREFRHAVLSPAYQNTFCRLYLDKWTQQEERWLDITVWNKTAGEVVEDDLIGETCTAGLDLSTRIDLTALVYVFPDEDGVYDILARHFIPAEGLQERSIREGVDYVRWVEEGYLIATPGPTIDEDFVIQQIAADSQKFLIQEMAFDRWGAQHITQRIDDEVGLDMVAFGQGYASMSEPTKALLELSIQKKLRHGHNPLLDYQADCMTVKQDPAGNIKPVKPDRRKSARRIDGMVALIMALDRARAQDNAPSVYEDRGLVTI